MSHSNNEKVALITGASSGIGVDVAELAAAAGYDLILVARRADRLRDVAARLEQQSGIKVETITHDLAPSNAAAELHGKVQALGRPIELLVNNAGLGLGGAFRQQEWHDISQMLNVNCLALTQLTHLFLPQMVERRHGGIMNVASVAGFEPGPFMACYYASKAYVLSFTEALAVELKGTGVNVTALCPGPTSTEFYEVAEMTTAPLSKMFMMSSKDVARAGFRALEANQTICIPGVMNQLVPQVGRFLPRKLVANLAGRLNSKR